MSRAYVGDSASKNSPKPKLITYLLSVLIAAGSLEVIIRSQYSEAQLFYLPYYGLSEDQQNLLIWQHQPETHEVGTITIPYSLDLYDSKLGWKVRPNANVKHSKQGLWEVGIQTNSFGLRGGTPKAQHKTGNVIRIGIVGASQTFGESVNDDEVYVSLLNKKFNDIEVLNFGVRGYGTDQMLLYYENEARNYDLDITILAFAFNHMPRNIRSFTFYAKPYFIRNGNRLDLLSTPVPSEFELFDKNIPKFNKYILNNSVLLRIGLKYIRAIRKRQLYKEESDVWNLTKAIVTKFSNIVKKNNSHFILLNIEHEYKELEPALQKLANEHNIDLINLGPTLRNALDSGIPAQIPNNDHWSAVGHKIVANAIHEHLCHKQRILNCS